jgi:hypothetical protein
MKIAIMTLGLHPRPLEHVIETYKPESAYVVASKEGLEYIAEEHGYKKPNEVILRDAAKRARCKLQLYRCDPFDPESISDVLGKILPKIDMDDEVIINYSGGTQAMSLVLGAVAVVLSRIMSVKVLYSTRLLPTGKEKIFDHTKPLADLFRRLYEILPGVT